MALLSLLSTTTLQVIPEEVKIKSQIELYAHQNGVDQAKMLALSKCESNFNPKAFNRTDPHGGAKGLFQYLQPTWDRWAKVYGGDMDIWNPYDQIKLTAFLLAQNKWSLWTCSKMI